MKRGCYAAKRRYAKCVRRNVIDALPREILAHVASFVAGDPPSEMAFMHVSRRFRAAAFSVFHPGLLFLFACGRGRALSVQWLLAIAHVDPTFAEWMPCEDGRCDAIYLSSSRGHAAVVRLLLADGRADPAARNNDAIVCSSANGHAAVVRLLLEDGRADPAALGSLSIHQSVHHCHADVVRLLLADGRADPTADDDYALRESSARGYASVLQLLLEDGRADPTAQKNEAIRVSSKNGHPEVVRLLLADGRADPAFTVRNIPSTSAICIGSRRGRAEVVRSLLADGRVDPAVGGSASIRDTCRRSCTGMVHLLLDDDPTGRNDHTIGARYCCEDAAVMRLLLDDGRADPTTGNNIAIRRSSGDGHDGVVRLLLEDGRADPTACNNDAIRRSSINRHTDALQLLLDDGRADPISALDEFFSERTHARVIRVLQADERVQSCPYYWYV
jgi:hypothetical protein